jgi:DNA-binding transcriptional ArsR family regulator
MANPDEIIHQSLRLRIMAALYAARDGDPIEFGRLKALIEATDGNLGSHLATLEGAGYLRLEKEFVGKKPRTRAAITRAGAAAFLEHTAYLRSLIDSANL